MKLFLWGAGGHGKVVYDVVASTGVFEEIAFVDDDPGGRSEYSGAAVLGNSDVLDKLRQRGFGWFLISIGVNATRAKCYRIALGHGLLPATATHPSAVVSASAAIGPGTVVMPKAVINAGAQVGENCIINTGAIVEHDCRVGNHVHVSPGAVLGGGATVEECAHVGIGAVILPEARVEAAAMVGAGAVVLRSVPAGATVVGIPASRVLRVSARGIKSRGG
jgi:sugar O-acyltransferase (sialic acid O-acetyltransferase NeuD family)